MNFLSNFLVLICIILKYDVMIVAGVKDPSEPILPLSYSAVALLSVYPADKNDTEPASSSLMTAFARDSVNDRTFFKYNLDPVGWAADSGYLYHLDVVKAENGKMYDYFWYEDTNGEAQECTKSEWTGSSNRTPFMSLSLEDGAVYLGESTTRGAASHCWSSEVAGYGPVKQCYIGEGIASVPWVFEGLGSCCPGPNRWDFGNYYTISKIEESVFSVPTCFSEM